MFWVTLLWGGLTLLLLIPASALRMCHSCALPVGICVVLAGSIHPRLPPHVRQALFVSQLPVRQAEQTISSLRLVSGLSLMIVVSFCHLSLAGSVLLAALCGFGLPSLCHRRFGAGSSLKSSSRNPAASARLCGGTFAIPHVIDPSITTASATARRHTEGEIRKGGRSQANLSLSLVTVT